MLSTSCGRLKLRGQNGKIGSFIPQRLRGKRRRPALTSKYQGSDTLCMRWQAIFSSSPKYCRNGTPCRLGCLGYLLTIYDVYPSRVQADSSDKRHICRRRPTHKKVQSQSTAMKLSIFKIRSVHLCATAC